MAVTYKKLWIMLIERDITKLDFRHMCGISPATMTKLNKNLHVNMETLEKICRTMHCTFDDIMEMLPEEEEGNVLLDAKLNV